MLSENWPVINDYYYVMCSQTSLTQFLVTSLSFSIYNDSVICMCHNPNTWVPSCPDKRSLTVDPIMEIILANVNEGLDMQTRVFFRQVCISTIYLIYFVVVPARTSLFGFTHTIDCNHTRITHATWFAGRLTSFPSR